MTKGRCHPGQNGRTAADCGTTCLCPPALRLRAGELRFCLGQGNAPVSPALLNQPETELACRVREVTRLSAGTAALIQIHPPAASTELPLQEQPLPSNWAFVSTLCPLRWDFEVRLVLSCNQIDPNLLSWLCMGNLFYLQSRFNLGHGWGGHTLKYPVQT